MSARNLYNIHCERKISIHSTILLSSNKFHREWEYKFKKSSTSRCTRIRRKIYRIDPSNETVKSRWNDREDVIPRSCTHTRSSDCGYCPRSYFQSSVPNNPPFPIYNSTPFPVEQENHLPAGGFLGRYTTHTGGDAVEKRARKRQGNTVCAGRTREQKITERTIWEITEAPVLVSNRLNPAAGRIPCCLSPSIFPSQLAFSLSLGLARNPLRTTWPFCIFSSAFCVLPRAPRGGQI